MIEIKVSSKWARKKFPCYPEHITSDCDGRCCEGSDKILITLLPDEAKYQETVLGHKVEGGKLLANPATGICVHKEPDGLCGLHDTRNKPFGCIASPFTLNKNNTLVVRYRYSRLKCCGQGEPAYIVFYASLVLLFGKDEAARTRKHLDAGGGDIVAEMNEQIVEKIKYLDGLKPHG